MTTWYLVSLFVHMLAAMVFVGGMVFLGAVLAPLLRRPDMEDSAGTLMRAAASRFGRIGAFSVVLLIVTGFTNAITRGYGGALFTGEFWLTPYAHMFGAKVVLAVAIVAVSLMHVGRSGRHTLDAMEREPSEDRTRRMRKSASRMGRVNLVLALVAVLLGLLMSRGLGT